MNFIELGLAPILAQALEKEKITKPAKVQEQTFKPIAEGKNVLAQSRTGSGKTLAYLLPLMQRYIDTESGNRALIIVPTHELAIQVQRQVKRTSEYAGLSLQAQPIVGNVNITRQIEYLKKKPQFIVGTPGRIYELIKKKKIAAHQIETIVLDEADKLLSVQQIEEVKAVVKCCMRDTQKLFFSASMSQEAKEAALAMADNLELFCPKEGLRVPENIKHFYIVCEAREKLHVLRGALSALHPKKAMVFINKPYDIERAQQKLQYHHYHTACIHGQNRKEERQKAIASFRKGQLPILIATDLASRGLHFEKVDLVVHYTIPESAEYYLHRAGRCARGAKSGINISIVTAAELKRIKQFDRALSLHMQEKILKDGKLISRNKDGKKQKF